MSDSARDPWSTEFDQVRATVQALQGAATLLQAAMEQRQGLASDMQNAEQRLTTLQQQQAAAEHALSSANAQLERTTRELERIRSEQNGLLADFDRLVQGALARRGALLGEIADLERQRADVAPTPLPQVVTEPPAVTAPEPLRLVTPPVAVTVWPVAAPAAAPEPPKLVALPPQPAPAPRREQKRRGLVGLRTLFTLTLGAMLVGLAVLLTPVTQLAGGLQLLAVMSGSMEPTIHVGGIVGVLPTPASDLKEGDVITFANQSNPDVLVTHRIVGIATNNGQQLLTTKGDANDSVDAVSVPVTRTVGRVDFTVPWLGLLMVWLSSPLARVGILAVSVIGFALPSFGKRSETEPAPPTEPANPSYVALEREIESLLPRAS